MCYHPVDPDELGRWDARPTDVRPLSVAAGYEYQNATSGMRVYELPPDEQSGLRYHYHDDQVEAFYMLAGRLHVETPEQEYAAESDEAFFVDPGSPQRAYNPAEADAPVRVLAVGAPSVGDAHPYEPMKKE